MRNGIDSQALGDILNRVSTPARPRDPIGISANNAEYLSPSGGIDCSEGGPGDQPRPRVSDRETKLDA